MGQVNDGLNGAFEDHILQFVQENRHYDRQRKKKTDFHKTDDDGVFEDLQKVRIGE
ncbi:hypothetical protein D3C81_1965240 [compost metagenome]